MTIQSYAQSSRSTRPFGEGLRDPDLRLVVASADVRYRQKVQAVIVRRPSRENASAAGWFATELIVLNSAQNIAELSRETNALNPDGRVELLTSETMTDVILVSPVTGERVMITSMPALDFKRIEQVANLEQIHIGGKEDRGSWVCRIIDAERLDALFSGRLIDVRSAAIDS